MGVVWRSMRSGARLTRALRLRLLLALPLPPPLPSPPLSGGAATTASGKEEEEGREGGRQVRRFSRVLPAA